MFLYFLDKNGILFIGGEKLIDDHTLVALTIMIAESRPEEKEIMIDVIMNCITCTTGARPLWCKVHHGCQTPLVQ